MLNWIYSTLGEAWGPLRLFNSFFFLSGAGFAICALGTWLLLPKLWGLLPTDRVIENPPDGVQEGDPVRVAPLAGPSSGGLPDGRNL